MKRTLPLLMLCCTTFVLLGCKKVKINNNDDNATKQEDHALIGTWILIMRGNESVTNGKTDRDSTVITIKFNDNNEYEVTYHKSNNPLWANIVGNTETFSGAYSFTKKDNQSNTEGTLILDSRDFTAALGAKWVTQLLLKQKMITGSTSGENQGTNTSSAASSVLNTLLTSEQHTNTLNELKKEVNKEKDRALQALEELEKNNQAPKTPSPPGGPEGDAKKRVEEIAQKAQGNNNLMDLVDVLVQLKVAPRAGEQQEGQQQAETEARLSVHTAVKSAIKTALESKSKGENYSVKKAGSQELILKSSDDKYITFDTSKSNRSANTRLILRKVP